MDKILVTNNPNLLSKEYNIIYTDSPYIVANDNCAIHLDTFLDDEYYKKILNIQKKGFEIDIKIIDFFFPNYKGRKIGILDIRKQYTLIFKKIYILYKLLAKHNNDEITIAITLDELYKDNYDPFSKVPFTNIERFINVYHWIAKRAQIKNVKLICKDEKYNNLLLLDSPIDSWFLRLINLDKKVLIFNLLKKIYLIKDRHEKVYIYKKSNIIREIEPYLYDKGISFVSMPEMDIEHKEINNILDEKKLKDILDSFFEDNILESTFKILLFDVCKKLIKYYLKNY